MFGFFARKSSAPADDPPLPTPTPSVASVPRFPTSLRSALSGSTTDLTFRDSDHATDSVAEAGKVNDAHFPVPAPPATPTPPPVPGPSEANILYDLVLSIPPKTLHAYTLAHLRPPFLPPPSIATASTSPAPASHNAHAYTHTHTHIHSDSTADIARPPSPNTVSKLAAFFSALAPPPLLHCVRCHKDFYDVENEEKDKACRVAHDDESTLVSRVSGQGTHETLWGCCGQTVPGDGSEGPPDGWCYEGRHTTDVKRARFRADSTMHDDKLTSCFKLNCRGIRDQLRRVPNFSPYAASPSRSVRTMPSVPRSNPSPARSLPASVLATAAPARKRPRKSLKEPSSSENENEKEEDGGGLTSRVAKAKAKDKDKDKDKEDEESEGGSAGDKSVSTNMEVDGPSSSSKFKSKSKTIPKPTKPVAFKTRSFVASRRSSLLSNPTPAKPAGPTPTPTKTAVTAATGRKTPLSKSTTLLSQSHTHLDSDSEASVTRLRPRTRSYVRDESRGRRAGTKASSPVRKLATRARAGRGSSAKKSSAEARLSPASASEEAPETEEEESDEDEVRGRERKKRRVGSLRS